MDNAKIIRVVLNPLNAAWRTIDGTRLPVACASRPSAKDRKKMATGAGIWGAWTTAKTREVNTIGRHDRPPSGFEAAEGAATRDSPGVVGGSNSSTGSVNG